MKAQGVASVPRLAAAGEAAKARVLIIDDNVELVGSLHAVLMSAELSDGRAASNTIEVVTASRGDEGLAEAQARGFDVAIVDVKLPDTSGVHLIPRLREACPLGEIVLMTGFATMDAAIGALRSGAYAFVPKSFRPEELISTVEQAVSKVRLARERDELERRYRALAELTDVLVVGIDSADRVALFNRKAALYAGVGAGEAVGRPFIQSCVPA
ncbi:MAG: response regulator, partial [Polyangiaceae bacterium]